MTAEGWKICLMLARLSACYVVPWCLRGGRAMRAVGLLLQADALSFTQKKTPEVETRCSQVRLSSFLPSGVFASQVGPDLTTRAVTAAGGLSATPGNGSGFGTVGVVLQAVHDD